MVTPFTPANGVQGRDKICADHVRPLPVEAQIPHSEIMDLLDCNLVAAQAAMRGALKILEENRENSFIKIKRFGWVKIDRGRNQLKETQRQVDKSVRALNVAARRALATDDDLLDQIGRQEKYTLIQGIARGAEIKSRKPRSLDELERMARARRQEIPDPRIRQLPTPRREDAG